MPGWTLVDTHPTQGRVFQRRLDVTELCFLWDGFCQWDCRQLTSQYYELHPSNGARDAHLLSEANIARAWVSRKRRFPLAGAIVRGADNFRVATDSKADDNSGFASEPHFVVREHDLAVLRPCDIVFGQVTDAEEAQQQAAAILQGPRLLSEESLMQLHVFRESDVERTDVLHLMILMAHCVTDDSDQNIRAMLVGYARERWRARAWLGSIGGEAGDGGSLNGSRTWASMLAQSGNTTVAEGNRDRDISTEDENDTGGYYLSGLSCATNPSF
ncbi:hypothetical protein JVT61DRAFT_11012 [Boletus reticuloceps]|uniref:Uncharacterized protein n=1 Tax=Boletus reticuloceps TaxID=495285 RepID=A0A8I2YF19_9AGAM|nr:hypothetical protein JVT61DRAFT_11012 [Boletus reticuloceps]